MTRYSFNKESFKKFSPSAVKNIYWTRTTELRGKYSQQLDEFIQYLRTNHQDSPVLKRAVVIRDLLRSNPRTHRAPCHPGILDAAERMLNHWLSEATVTVNNQA